jgi:anti-sigma B factor antagonist
MSAPQPASVLPLTGVLDLHVSPTIATLIGDKIKERPSRLVVDVSQVSYVDSSGLAVLINAMRDMEDCGGLFMLAGVQEDVQAILESARLEKFFLIFPTVAEALAAP